MAALAAVCGALLTSGLATGTFALYEGETENAGSTFSGGWVGPAENIAATPEGYDVKLGWTAGTQGPVTGQKLYGTDNGLSSTCTESSSLIKELSATASSYSDESRGNASNDGDWFCYEVQSTSATAWTAQATKAVQVGLVSSAVSTSNGSSKCTGASAPASSKIDCNDQVEITFNQKPILPSSPIVACVWTAGSVVLGESGGTCGKSASASEPSVGKLTVSGATIKANAKYESSPYTLSASAPWTMTVTLVGNKNNATVEGTPTWTLTPAATIKSSIATHQATICSAAKTTCRPTTTTKF